MNNIKKLDIGGIKQISAKDLQRSFFNETLEDERIVQSKNLEKSNSRKRLVVDLINENSGYDFNKLYNVFTRMTEEEFVMFESVLRKKLYLESESYDMLEVHDRPGKEILISVNPKYLIKKGAKITFNNYKPEKTFLILNVETGFKKKNLICKEVK